MIETPFSALGARAFELEGKGFGSEEARITPEDVDGNAEDVDEDIRDAGVVGIGAVAPAEGQGCEDCGLSLIHI